MKLLLFPPYFSPELMAGAKLADERYRAFADAGIQMESYVPMPTRGVSSEQRSLYRKRKNEILYNGSMTLHRYTMFNEHRNPILKGLRYFACFFKQLYWGICSNQVDAIFLVSTPPINGLVGGILKKYKNIPFIYNLQDVFPDSLSSLGFSPNSVIWKIGRKIENYTYKHADKIIVISEDIKQNIIKKGVSEEKIELIYNWIDEELIHPVNKEDNPLYDEYSISKDKFNIVYAGNLGNAQNIQILIDAAEILSERSDINFLIFGTGGLEQDIKEQIKAKKLHNIRVLPLQSYDRVPFVYSLGDACVVSCKKGLGGSAMPSKSVTIMATGRPLLVNFDKGELESIIEENQCGLFSEAGNLDQFVSSIMTFYNDREICENYGRNARELVLEKFTKDVNVAKYVEVIKSLN